METLKTELNWAELVLEENNVNLCNNCSDAANKATLSKSL